MGTRVLITGGGTGGHLYPALNLADALRRRAPEVELLYVGSRRGLEADVLPGRGLEHRLLPVGPLHRSRPWRSWRSVAAGPAALAGASRAGGDFDPDLVVGTGGYASGPAVLWAWLARRPLALQEQNAEPGLVTRWMARRADQVHLGFPEAEARLRTGKRTQLLAHGNPVAPPGEGGAATFDWPEGRVLLVAGGSQGARGLNDRLLADLRGVRAWPADLEVVWIAGREHADELGRDVDGLPWAGRIRVVPYIEELGRQLDRVTMAVGRAGAMFVSELAAAGVPSVLVPYPAAAGGHQGANARALREAGAAAVREEEDLEDGELWRLVSRILSNERELRSMAEAAAARGAPDAADRIAADLLRLAGAAAGGAADRAGGSSDGATGGAEGAGTESGGPARAMDGAAGDAPGTGGGDG